MLPHGRARLDHAAHAPVRAEVAAALAEALAQPWGNPSAAHAAGRAARQAIDEALERIGAVLGCQPGEVVLTSGGTEADHLAIAGPVAAARRAGTPSEAIVVACSAAEHKAVVEPVTALGGTVLPVDPAGGRIDLGALAALLDEAAVRSRHLGVPLAGVVSVMAANNETGACSPVGAVADLLEAHPGVALHVDAVQAATWLDLADPAGVGRAGMASVSGHKVGAPVGVGALVVRGGTPLAAVQAGGGQQRGRRGGTEGAAMAVALAMALELAAEERAAVVPAVAGARDRLVAALHDACAPVTETLAPDVERLPGHAHVRLAGVESEALLALLDRQGVEAAAGSACASGALEASHVLLAMGLPAREALTSLRLTLGPATTAAEVDHAVGAIAAAVRRLRASA